jgi:hypothetical protein
MTVDGNQPVSANFPYRYKGDRFIFYDEENALGWGAFCVDNRARSLRVLPPDRPCPFCGPVMESHDRRMNRILFHEHVYIVVENHNPTVDEQLLTDVTRSSR